MASFTLEDLMPVYERLLKQVKIGAPELADDVMKVPVTDYTDPDLWAREVEMFRTKPMLLAFTNELKEPGSYWAMQRVGVPLLLTRTKTGEPRLFLNACRHRGHRVAHDGQGKAARFTCGYHSWTYATDGRLIGLPSKEIFGDIDRACYGLTELAVEERGGLIWGILTPGIELDLDDWLGEMGPLVAKGDFERFELVERIEFDCSNWKMASEGYLETYHFRSLHDASFMTFMYPEIMAFNSIGRHSRVCTPALGIDKFVPGDNPNEMLRYVQQALFMFPSTGLIWASDLAFAPAPDGEEPIERLLVPQVLPGNKPGESLTIQRTMVSRDVRGTPREAEAKEWARGTHRVVVEEDNPAVSECQATLKSGANEFLTIGRNELGIHHLHRTIAAVLAEDAEKARRRVPALQAAE